MINLYNIHNVANQHPEVREFKIASGRKIFDDFTWWLIDEKDEVSQSLIDETIKVGLEKINLIFGHLAESANSAANNMALFIAKRIKDFEEALELEDDEREIKNLKNRITDFLEALELEG
jgi:hypothetical protein